MKVKSTGYFLLRELVRIPYRLFYRKIKVVGKENIPTEKPIIFAPNHQNALMDPLAMIFSTPRQIVFLARGDIFKGKLLISILNFIKILPVYRQHDGKAALKKNDKVFAQSVDYLQKLGPFCLFPESKHNPHRNLRPLKKGIPRIAFQALKATDYSIDIKIIPTGIYYENKDESHSYLQIKYGQPISVNEYIEQVKENEQKAMASLSKAMAPEIKPLIMDIPEDEDYSTKEKIRSLYADRLMNALGIKSTDENRFTTDQALIEHLSGQPISEGLKKNIERLYNKLEKKKWTVSTITKEMSTGTMIGRIVLFDLLSPLAILGFLINFLPFTLSKYIRKNMIKDPQFTSSINFVVGAILMPIYFLIISLLSLIFLKLVCSLGLLILLPVISYIGYIYLKKLNSFRKSMAYKNSEHRMDIERIKKLIFDELDQMFSDFKGITKHE